MDFLILVKIVVEQQKCLILLQDSTSSCASLVKRLYVFSEMEQDHEYKGAFKLPQMDLYIHSSDLNDVPDFLPTIHKLQSQVTPVIIYPL